MCWLCWYERTYDTQLFVAVGDKGAGTSYVGQPIGCIVAVSRREAEAATEAVKVREPVHFCGWRARSLRWII